MIFYKKSIFDKCIMAWKCETRWHLQTARVHVLSWTPGSRISSYVKQVGLQTNIIKRMVIESAECVWKCSQFDSAAKGHAIQFTLNAEYSSRQNTWKQMILSEPTASLSSHWIKAICWLLNKCIIFYLDSHLLPAPRCAGERSSARPWLILFIPSCCFLSMYTIKVLSNNIH